MYMIFLIFLRVEISHCFSSACAHLTAVQGTASEGRRPRFESRRRGARHVTPGRLTGAFRASVSLFEMKTAKPGFLLRIARDRGRASRPAGRPTSAAFSASRFLSVWFSSDSDLGHSEVSPVLATLSL